MKTIHTVHFTNAKLMNAIPDQSVALVVTSPPYPMIEMWDAVFSQLNPKIADLLANGEGNQAFHAMHEELSYVWKEIYRVLIPGGFACINIGDATRTIQDKFQLYPNHAQIISDCHAIGFCSLPEIVWRKQTNAPNKFMGSGMLPGGAYVTLEHEYILIFRKGEKRVFDSKDDKVIRQESAYFWEERNKWFSDLWDMKGTTQSFKSSTAAKSESLRNRSAAFPFEVAYRLINMYSAKSETILDPFLGTGTTMLAAMVSHRNSIGYEVEAGLKLLIEDTLSNVVSFGNQYLNQRIKAHKDFMNSKLKSDEQPKYMNIHYGFPVVTGQEVNLKIDTIRSFNIRAEKQYEVEYK